MKIFNIAFFIVYLFIQKSLFFLKVVLMFYMNCEIEQSFDNVLSINTVCVLWNDIYWWMHNLYVTASSNLHLSIEIFHTINWMLIMHFESKFTLELLVFCIVMRFFNLSTFEKSLSKFWSVLCFFLQLPCYLLSYNTFLKNFLKNL